MLAMFLFSGAEILLLMMLVLMGWAIVSAIQNHGISDSERICWVLAILFLNLIGSVLYLAVGHPKRNTPLPR
jgi:uncharacterized membrane protein